MSYISKVLPYIPAELNEFLDIRGCNWAVPYGLHFRTSVDFTEVFVASTDTFVLVDHYDHTASIIGSERLPIDITNMGMAMYGLFLADCVANNKEFGMEADASIMKKLKEVTLVLTDGISVDIDKLWFC